MSTDSSSKQTADTATAQQTKTSAPAQQPAQQKSASPAAPAAPAAKAEPKYKSEDFDGAPIVKLKLKEAGIMQFDPIYRIKLDSTEPTELPLTPFFAGRLGSTIDLCP